MHDFTVIALEGGFASGLALSIDTLRTAAALAPRLKLPPPRYRVCSADGGELALQNGMRLRTQKLPAAGDRSVWVLPGFGLDTPELLRTRMEDADARRLVRALARHAHAGGTVAASCSAVFFLQAAGLLAGRKATTTWWLAPLLQRLQPDARVDADRMVCVDGPVTTAGAAFAQGDLMLHLLKRRFGNELAQSVSRMLLIDGRRAQAPYVAPEAMAGGDRLVARVCARIEQALPDPPPVAQLARELHMSGRTLSRHVRSATGKSTLALVQGVKLRRARVLIETSRLTIEQIAERVGYRDSTALRRLMKKQAGANPSQYRPGRM